jgi:hypothetical protein
MDGRYTTFECYFYASCWRKCGTYLKFDWFEQYFRVFSTCRDIYFLVHNLRVQALLLKMDKNVLLIFLLLGNSLWFYDPPNTSLEDNFANDKGTPQHIQSYYIEPSDGWSMCSKNRMARCPTVVE